MAHPGVGGVSGRSPSTASVPIPQTLVPPTPSSLHHPGYSGERSAFLAPLEQFYDSLSSTPTLQPVDPLSRRPETGHRMSSPNVEPCSTPDSQTSSPDAFDVGKCMRPRATLCL